MNAVFYPIAGTTAFPAWDGVTLDESYATYGILFILLLASCVTDLWRGRIYNMVVLPALAAGVLLRLAGQGVEGFPALAVSLGFPLLLLPFWVIGRGIGGGDIKLLLAASSLMSPAVYIQCMAAAVGISAVLALCLLAAVRTRKAALPMALPVAAGTFAVFLYRMTQDQVIS